MSFQNLDLARSVAVERERDLQVRLAQRQADLSRPSVTHDLSPVAALAQRWHDALVHLHLAHRAAR
ncbi:hypothetical protein [Ornithinimicrobium cerasi]|uniref:Uncharacterized protein n=1 Tax=Ornithinimicrobium cerasi TaxID=2248773 RepID=A0A285VJG2_9MICO|nr:hypothetical protein [Ornithinimicrobium cerasi]SOC54220.1 hypothetical protein SAMN05421879_10314 [Ornithinimicrobium cerasi]